MPCPTRARARCLAFTLLLLAGAALAEPKDVAPTGVLRVAFLGANPVQGNVNPQTKEITGVVADLTKELARRLGVPYEIYPAANAAEIIARLNAGKSDVGYLAFDAERGALVDYSASYALMGNALVVRADATIKKTADADTPDTKLAAVKGQTQQIVLSDILKRAPMTMLEKKPSPAQLEQMLSSKQIDAYGANRPDAEMVAAASGGKLRALPDDFFVAEQAFVSPKGEKKKIAELDKFVEAIRADGYMQQTLDRTHLAGLAVAKESHR
ncbi:MAG: amino acid transporter substrate-binding protein [Betaproteobacteria bacterium]|nr:amino acid transporter substrate-binding protein [Betaproteobacteria bacterium]